MADEPSGDVVELLDLDALFAAREAYLGFFHRVQQGDADIQQVVFGELPCLLHLAQQPLVHQRAADLFPGTAEHVAQLRVSGAEVARLDHRHIQRAAAEIEHHIDLAFAHVLFVSEDAGGGLVEHAHRAAIALQHRVLQPVGIFVVGLHRQRDHQVFAGVRCGGHQYLADQVFAGLARGDQIAVDTARAVVVAQDVELEFAEGAAVAGQPGVFHFGACAQRMAFAVMRQRRNHHRFLHGIFSRQTVAIGLGQPVQAQGFGTARGRVPAHQHGVAGAEVQRQRHGAAPELSPITLGARLTMAFSRTASPSR